MTYNVFSGTLNPTHFTSLHVGHIGATWRIRLNRPRLAEMRPYVTVLWPLVLTVMIDLFACVWSVGVQGSLEVYWADVALSMETAYSLLLGDSVPIHHYHVFAHLCRYGYIVRRHSAGYVFRFSLFWVSIFVLLSCTCFIGSSFPNCVGHKMTPSDVVHDPFSVFDNLF